MFRPFSKIKHAGEDCAYLKLVSSERSPPSSSEPARETAREVVRLLVRELARLEAAEDWRDRALRETVLEPPRALRRRSDMVGALTGGCGLEGCCCCEGVVGGRDDEMERRGEDEILIGQMTLPWDSGGKSCQGSRQGWELRTCCTSTYCLPA